MRPVLKRLINSEGGDSHYHNVRSRPAGMHTCPPFIPSAPGAGAESQFYGPVAACPEAECHKACGCSAAAAHVRSARLLLHRSCHTVKPWIRRIAFGLDPGADDGTGGAPGGKVVYRVVIRVPGLAQLAAQPSTKWLPGPSRSQSPSSHPKCWKIDEDSWFGMGSRYCRWGPRHTRQAH